MLELYDGDAFEGELEEKIEKIVDEIVPKKSVYEATVIRQDSEGTWWVRFPGTEDETPVMSSTVDMRVGDIVTIELEDHVTRATGNLTSPPMSAAASVEYVSGELQPVSGYVKELKANDITAETLHATEAYIGSLVAKEIDAETISATQGYITTLVSGHVTAEELCATHAMVSQLDALGITAQTLSADHADIETLKTEKADIDDLTAINASISTLTAADATITSNLTAAEGRITSLETNSLTATSAVIVSLQAKDAAIDQVLANKADIDDLTAATARIGTIEADYLQAADMTAEVGRVNQLLANYTTTENLAANYATIERLESAEADIDDLSANKADVDDLTAATARIGTIEADYLQAADMTAESARVDSLLAGKASVTDLNAATGRITTLESSKADITLLESDYITAAAIDAAYAQIDFANVTASWIQNGTIKNAAITNEMVQSVSANKLTAGTIDANKINVANLRAKNLIVEKLNGQPVLGGYELVSSDTTGYSSKNPSSEGWYEYSNGTYTLSSDTTVNASKAYYTDGQQVALYDQTYIDGLEDRLDQRIDGAVETFTGTDIPTLSNYPVSGWAQSQYASHVGDIYYIVDPTSNSNGYCYRFAYDNTSSSYTWVLIKDSDVTAALGEITDLQTFQSTTESWIEETDEGLRTIRENHTTLSGVVNKTVKASTQLWYTKANTTAPTAPVSQVSSTSTAGNAWTTVVPVYNASYPNYFYCWQYQYVDNTYGWSAVVLDSAMSESQERARTAESKIDNLEIGGRNTLIKSAWFGVDRYATSNVTKSWIADSSAPCGYILRLTPNSSDVNRHVFLTFMHTNGRMTDGETYTASVWLRASKTTSFHPNTNMECKSGSYERIGNDEFITEQWKRFSIVFNYSASTTYNAWYLIYPQKWTDMTVSDYVDVGGVKIEKGNHATDWSPAPEDAQEAADNAQSTANANIKSSVMLWYTSNSTTPPAKPYTDGSTSYVSSTATTANAWTTVVPVYSASTPKYHYCYQQQRGDGTYQWTSPVYDDATTTAMAKAQAALPSSTFTTFETTTFKNLVDEVDEQSSTITTMSSRVDSMGMGMIDLFSMDIWESGSTGSDAVGQLWPDKKRVNTSRIRTIDTHPILPGKYTVTQAQGYYSWWYFFGENGGLLSWSGWKFDLSYTLEVPANATCYSVIVRNSASSVITDVSAAANASKLRLKYAYADASEVSALSTTVNSVQQTANSNSASITSLTTTVEKNYLKETSKGEQLIVNGSGLMGDNTNFSSWTYDPSVSINGSTGSFTTNGREKVYRVLATDEFFPVNVDDQYLLSYDLTVDTDDETYPVFYSFVALYDIDKRGIEYINVHYPLGTMTTLARDLSKGDTEVYLTNIDSSFVYASNKNGLSFWNYVNSVGYAYPAGTYTRNIYTSLYDSQSSIDTVNNKIVLKSAWTADEYPAGIPVSQSMAGANYVYVAANGITLADGPMHRSGTIGPGLVTAITVVESVPHKFREATAYAKIGFLWNYQAKSNAQIWLANLSFAKHVASQSDLDSLTTTTTSKFNTIDQTLEGIATSIGSIEETLTEKADGSTVSSLTTKVNNIEDTVDGHTQTISSVQSTQTTMGNTLKTAIKSTTQLWYSKADTTAPNRPTGHVSSTATTGGAWTTAVPAYSASYPNYFYCYEWQYTDNTYGWSGVTHDIAMGETQERARTAESKIDNLEIGGRNLVRYSNQFRAGTVASSATMTQTVTDEGYYKMVLNGSNNSWNSFWFAVQPGNSWALVEDNLSAGDDYTVSFLMRAEGNTKKPKFHMKAGLSYYDLNGDLSENWSTVWHTRKWVDTESIVPHLGWGDITSGTYYIKAWKIEKGNRPTDWSPAPEDAQEAADNAQATADKNVRKSAQLWFTKANSTAPSKPSSKVTTSNAATGNAWNLAVPTYNSSYPHYFYCYQYELADGTYDWSDVVYDAATTENQATSRSAASGVSTLTTRTNQISDTVDGHTSQITHVTKTANASGFGTIDYSAMGIWESGTTSNATIGKTYDQIKAAYAAAIRFEAPMPITQGVYSVTIANGYQYSTHFFDIDGHLCQTQTWTSTAEGSLTVPQDARSVVFLLKRPDGNAITDVDAAADASKLRLTYAYLTEEDVSEFRSDYATFKQTVNTFQSTVGTTYATKTELSGAASDLENQIALASTSAELTKTASGGRSIFTENAAPLPLIDLEPVYGESVQDGTPTPEEPKQIYCVRASNVFPAIISGSFPLPSPFSSSTVYVGVSAYGNYTFVDRWHWDGTVELGGLTLSKSTVKGYSSATSSMNCRIVLSSNTVFTGVKSITVGAYFKVSGDSATGEVILRPRTNGSGSAVTVASYSETIPKDTWTFVSHTFTKETDFEISDILLFAVSDANGSASSYIQVETAGFFFALGAVNATVYSPSGFVPVVSSGSNFLDESLLTNTSSNLVAIYVNVPNGTYTVSSTCPLDQNTANILATAGYLTSYSGKTTNNSGVSNGISRTLEVTDGVITLFHRKNSSKLLSDYENWINFGSEPMAYEPYQEHVTYLDLQDTELHGLDETYRDILRIDERGHAVVEKRCGKVVIDGTHAEYFMVSSGQEGCLNAFYFTKNYWTSEFGALPQKYMYAGNTVLRCDRLPIRTSTGYKASTSPFITAWGDSSATFIMGFDSSVTTKSEAATWLDANPVTIVYPIEEPYTIDLGHVDLPQTFDGGTVYVDTEVQPVIGGSWWTKAGYSVGKLAEEAKADRASAGTLVPPYTELEWVESDGTQFVYLDWKPPIATWGFYIDFENKNAVNTSAGGWNPTTNVNGYGSIFGTRKSSTVNNVQLSSYYNGTLRIGAGNVAGHGYVTDKSRQRMSLIGTTLTKPDGTTATLTRVSETVGSYYANMVVFACHDGARRSGTGGLIEPSTTRIYSLKFYEGDEVAVDLVGAKRKSDGMTGLYDKVKGHFYPASKLSCGAEIGDLGESGTISGALSKQNVMLTVDNRTITRMWEAEAPTLEHLDDGQQITVTFMANVASSSPDTIVAAGYDDYVGWDEVHDTKYSYVLLKLTLSDGSKTEWIPCYYSQGTRLTNHYGSGNPVLMTYRENAHYGETATSAGNLVMRGWWADPNYVDGNTVYTKFSDTIIAGKNGLKPYTLCMKDDEGNWTTIVNQASTGVSDKTCYTGGLQLGGILYHITNSTYVAGANGGQVWESYGGIDFRYSANGITNAATTTLQLRKPLYLVGTLDEDDGLYYLDTVKWWTQDTFQEGRVYVQIGSAYNSYYAIFLAANNPSYVWDPTAQKLVEFAYSRIKKAETAIVQTNDLIGFTATSNYSSLKEYADGMIEQEVSDRNSAISDMADEISLTVSQTYTSKASLDTRVHDEDTFLRRQLPSTVHTGAARIASIKGNTVKWNQNFNMVASVVSGLSKCSRTLADGALTITSQELAPNAYCYITFKITPVRYHYYLIGFKVTQKTVEGFNVWSKVQNNETNTIAPVLDSRGYGRFIQQRTQPSDALFIIGSTNFTEETSSVQFTLEEIMYFDLTLMFGEGNEPATVAEFEALFSEPYYPYDPGSLLSVNVEGMKAIGFNQWNGTYKSGDQHFDYNTGVFDTQGGWTCTDKIKVSPSIDYYITKDGSSTSFIVGNWDASDNFLGTSMYSNANRVFTTKSGAAYIRTEWTGSAGNVCINISDPDRNGEYEPYVESTREFDLSGHFPTGLKSAGTIYDELDFENRKAVTRIGAVDLGTLNWAYHSSSGQFRVKFTDAVRPTAQSVLSNIICVPYTTVTFSTNGIGSIDKSIARYYSSVDGLNIRDDSFSGDAAAFKSAMSGVMLYYELAEPVETDISDALQSTYSVEAGGTEFVLVDEEQTAPQSAPVPFVFEYGLSAMDALADAVVRMSSAESAIVQNADNISLKVSQTDYNGQTVASLINQSPDEIKIQANHVQINGATTFVSGNTTSNLAEYLGANYDSKGSATAAVDGLKIGGTNLLRWTKSPKYAGAWTKQSPDQTSGWYPYSSSFTIEDTTDGIKGSASAGNAGFVIPFSYKNAAIGGKEYTLSFDYRTNYSGTSKAYLLVETGSNSMNGTISLTASETNWAHYQETLIWPSTSGQTTIALLVPYQISGKWFEIRDGSMQLEEGNKASSWSQAPEDVQASIDGVQDNLDNLEIGSRNYAKTNVNIGTNGTSQGVTFTVMGPSTVKVNGTASAAAASGNAWFGGVTLDPGDYILWLTNTNNGTLWFRLGVGPSRTHVYSTSGNYTKNAPYRFTVTTAAEYWFGVVCAVGTYSNVETSFMLEKGNKATDWQPAPEDLVLEEQYVYLQVVEGTSSVSNAQAELLATWITATDNSVSGTAPDATENQTAHWTTKRPEYQTNYPVIFVAKQTRRGDGQVTYTTPVKDDSLTIIDGGHITTGTIDASVVTVDNIDAGNIKSGYIDAARIQAGSISADRLDVFDVDAQKISASAIDADNLVVNLEKVTGTLLVSKVDGLEGLLSEKVDVTGFEDLDNYVRGVRYFLTTDGTAVAGKTYYERSLEGDDYLYTPVTVSTGTSVTGYYEREALTDSVDSRLMSFGNELDRQSESLDLLSTAVRIDAEAATVSIGYLNSSGEFVAAKSVMSENGFDILDSNGTVITHVGDQVDIGRLDGCHITAVGNHMSFMNGNNEVAYIDVDSNGESVFYMTRSVVVKDMFLGENRWKFFKRDNNNLSLKWTGV